MESNQGFFSGTALNVLLGSPTLQSTSRRICIPISMPLDGETFSSMPDWVGTAYEAVAKSFPEVDPGVAQVADITLNFFNEEPKGQLFNSPSAKVPNGELKRFVVLRAGDAEDPTVELHFKAYAPFSRDFWKWIGEFAGSKVYMAFPKRLGAQPEPAPKQDKLPGALVTDQPATDEEKAILAGDFGITETFQDENGKPIPDPRPAAAAKKAAVKGTGITVVVPPAKAKSGPKELAAEHARQGAKSKRVN